MAMAIGKILCVREDLLVVLQLLLGKGRQACGHTPAGGGGCRGVGSH